MYALWVLKQHVSVNAADSDGRGFSIAVRTPPSKVTIAGSTKTFFLAVSTLGIGLAQL